MPIGLRPQDFGNWQAPDAGSNVGMGPEDFFALRANQIYNPSNFDAPEQNDLNLNNIMQGYKPQTKISDLYQQSLLDMPQRQQPGKLRHIAAALAGLSGDPKAADFVLNKPYYTKLQDWETKTGALGKGATEEDKRNINSRLAITQQVANIIKQQNAETASTRAADAAANQEAKNRIAQQRADIAQERADVYKDIAKGGTVQTDYTGKSFMVYKDGTKKDLDLNKFTPEEIQEFKTEGRLKEIAAQGSQARQTEATKQGGREAIAETRGWHVYNVPDPDHPDKMKAIKINEITGETKEVYPSAVAKPSGAATANKPPSASQDKVAIFNRAQQAKNQHPEWAKYISATPDGAVKVEKPYWGGDDAVLKQVNDFIYPPATQKPKTEEERVVVYDLKTGKDVATIPKSNVVKLDKTKYGVR